MSREAMVERLVSSDGVSVEARLYRAAEARSPAVLLLPAMGVKAIHYERVAWALVDSGIHAAIIDLRGVGTSSQRASRQVDFGYGALVSRDLPEAVAHIRRRVPEAPLYLLGHSLGGHLALLYLARFPDAPIAGVALVASGSPYFRAWPGARGAGVLAFVSLAPLVASAFGYFPGTRLGFGGREARTLMKEWAGLGRTGRFQVQGWPVPGAEDALREVRRPVLVVTLEGDGFAPRTAAEHLVSKIPAAPVEHWHHVPPPDGPRVDHFRWLRHPEGILPRVVGFVTAGGSAQR